MTEIHEYVDPIVGCAGYLVYDANDCRLAAGGCRVQPGLTAATLVSLAARMTLKQRILGLNVDGAKCGLDYDPHAPDCPEALERFLVFLRTELTERFSMGCDMGTRFDELQRIASRAGLSSVKYAVKKAQELTDEDFWRRMRVLDTRVGTRTVGQRRAGHVLAHASLAAARACGYRPGGLNVGVQGFGNLGRAAAESLVESGARVTAVADQYGCVLDPYGLDIPHMLSVDQWRSDRSRPALVRRFDREALFELPLDVLILAAGEDAVPAERAATLPVPVVVVGANCGLSQGAERVLFERGVMVVPDFVGGAGGSASMEALFGPACAPTPQDVLDHVAVLASELVSDVISGARGRGVSPADVARTMAAVAPASPDRRPYGFSPYGRAERPRGNRIRPVDLRVGAASQPTRSQS